MANIYLTINTDVVNINFPATAKQEDGFADWLIAALMTRGDTPAPDTPAPDTPAPDTPASDTPASDTPASDTPASDTAVAENVMTYSRLMAGKLQEGDYVHWSGTKWQFDGVVVGNPEPGTDDGKPVMVVRIQREDSGNTVKLNIAADATGTLTLL